MKAKFDLIRYANCWEDADVLLKGLAPAPGSRILSIASAGDNSFSLLSTGAEKVIAVDLSPVQLYLVALKQAAIKHLSYEEYLNFIGINKSDTIVSVYKSLRSELTSDARNYWDQNLSILEEGLINAGKFEKYFALFRKWILPLIHSGDTNKELFREKTEQQQIEFYTKVWNNKRWRLLFSVFFGKYVMGKYGRDPEFLKQVKGSVSDHIFSKAEKHLQSTQAQENYFLHFIHLGNFGENLPHYIRPENYLRIKGNINALELKLGSVEKFVHKEITHFNLSNIFEYMPMPVFKECIMHFNANMNSSARLAYWNLMVPRKFSDVHPDVYQYDRSSEAFLSLDKGFFYNQFIVENKK